MRIDPLTLLLVAAAGVPAVLACLKGPGLPLIGGRNGLSFLWSLLPRLIPGLIVAGLVQVLVAPQVVSRGSAFPVLAGRLVAVFSRD